MKILHLFYDLLNLYGEYGNLCVLERGLKEKGTEVTVDKLSIGDEIDFSQCAEVLAVNCNFNYVEIGQGERTAFGEVPPEALNRINEMCQQGLTIWHNHANVGNYLVANGIVS